MMKKYITALLIILPILSFGQNTEKALTKKADSLFVINNFTEASILYKKIISNYDYNPEIFNNLAKSYMGNNKLDSAKIILNKNISLDGSNAESYSNMANIYLSLEQFDSALMYIQSAKILNPNKANYDAIEGYIYLTNNSVDTAFLLFNKALMKDKKNASANFYIAYIYSNNNILDSALKYIEVALESGGKSEYYKLKADILFNQQRYTDALFEIDKAIKIDDNVSNIAAKAMIHSNLEQYRDVLRLVLPKIQNSYYPDLVYYAVIGYYNLGMIDSALYFISYAHQEDENNDLFYYLDGYISYNMQNYENAYLNFKTAINLNPNEPDYMYLYCESKLLMNTDSSVLNMNNKFIEINQDKISKLSKIVKNKKSKYYFAKLLAKFNAAPTSLSLDEYFMLYLGNSQEDNYSGYSNSSPAIADAFEDNNYQRCIDLSKQFLSNHPTSVITYFYLSNAYYSLQKYELAMKYLTAYYGFMFAIIATGDGLSPEKSFIVTSVNDEYLILNFYNLTFAGQKLITKKKHRYDVIYFIDNNKKSPVYFNIDSFVGKIK